MKTNIIYALSTAPFYAKTPHKQFHIDRFELYTAAISSLTRRAAGDETVMHCDSRGAEYFRSLGLDDLWDEIKLSVPDDLDGINPKMFWAAGKLFALQATLGATLMLDTDFIAWRLPKLESELIAAHREPLAQNIYPSISHFNMRDGYSFDKVKNYNVAPLNTAFLYINNDEFKQYYVERAMAFMKSALPCDDSLTYMVYAEQRLLAILAEHKNIKADTILEYEQVYTPQKLYSPQKNYTHIWGAKQIMRDNAEEQERFCEKCRQRIRADFPKWVHIIDVIERT